MNKYLKHLLILLTPLLLLAGPVYPSDTLELGEFTKNDRVLVLAPHPDDEAIACSGMIQRALKSGAKVQVACYTNGDNNEFAFIVYEKRITFKKGEFLHMGEVRRKETIAGMKFLGLGPENVKFMGYPDFGTMEIMTKYWQTKVPFRSMLTRITKVSYPESLSIGAPYVGESILEDLKTILRAFRPTKVFVSHPADSNRDHQALYLFSRVALWDLEGDIDSPVVYPYIVHVAGWPRPRGHHLNLELHPPNELTGMRWTRLDLTPEEIENKQKVISFHKSQIEYNPPYLFTFARKNELYGDLPLILVSKGPAGAINWQSTEIKRTHVNAGPENRDNKNNDTPLVSYACEDNFLLIRLALRNKISKNVGVFINLLGYNHNKNFSRMPKLNITIGLLGMRIKDKKAVLFIRQAKVSYEGRNLIVKIPLSSLGNPEYVMARVKRRLFRFPLDEGAWRIVKLE
jgi:LmbE family N-acetylglucosaminyl deacetylase